MIELYSVDLEVHHPIQHVRHVDQVGRVASLRLAPGSAVPESRSQPVLIVAVTDVDLEVGVPQSRPTRTVSLRAGEVEFLSSGVAVIRNAGRAHAQFSLIDVRGAALDGGADYAP
ncbi:MAG: hypothetical protein NXI12_06320 [Alphaproteobacteria bacterium]|nr:hypothetical protein [Alphaproteobacteria bacterium]